MPTIETTCLRDQRVCRDDIDPRREMQGGINVISPSCRAIHRDLVGRTRAAMVDVPLNTIEVPLVTRVCGRKY